MYPAEFSPPPAPVLLTVGDIHCTQTAVIVPHGTYGLAGTQWTHTDMSHTRTSIPAWAIVCAIIFFFFCLLGLLFLLVKEEQTSGYAQVSVQGPNLLHTTQIPINSLGAAQDIAARVAYARQLAHAASFA